jgi:hypothetical protein
MGTKKSNYKEILNMKYQNKGIKPLFMVVYSMKLGNDNRLNCENINIKQKK